MTYLLMWAKIRWEISGTDDTGQAGEVTLVSKI